MNLFLTGATGFFGKSFLDYLIKNNIYKNVYCLSRNPEAFLQKYPQYNLPQFIFIKGDIKSFDVNQINCDHVIHAAASADEQMYQEYPYEMLKDMVLGTTNILEKLKSLSAKRFLFISSGAVYGKQPDNLESIPETFIGQIDFNSTKSSYAEGKRVSELLVRSFCEKNNIHFSIARCFAFWGPHLPLNKHFAIGNFINDAQNGRDIIVKGNGKSIRSYMHTDDLSIWIFTILQKADNGEIFNVGSDEEISIKNLATHISKHHSVNIIIENKLDHYSKYVPNVSKYINKFKSRILKKILDSHFFHS